MPFYTSAFLAGVSGLAGGFVGSPADLINVRMQNDIRLPPEQRRKWDNFDKFFTSWMKFTSEILRLSIIYIKIYE